MKTARITVPSVQAEAIPRIRTLMLTVARGC